MAITDYKDLDVWKKAMRLALRVYQMTARFPGREMYGLTSQMRRASVSVASNIAEGHERRTRKEFVQFLHTAMGSCAELETQFLLAKALRYIGADESEEMERMILDTRKLLRGTVRALNKTP
jgi:four helix bundle protein